jgi:hypothetical protein
LVGVVSATGSEEFVGGVTVSVEFEKTGSSVKMISGSSGAVVLVGGSTTGEALESSTVAKTPAKKTAKSFIRT